jgi:hypothetical protein
MNLFDTIQACVRHALAGGLETADDLQEWLSELSLEDLAVLYCIYAVWTVFYRLFFTIISWCSARPVTYADPEERRPVLTLPLLVRSDIRSIDGVVYQRFLNEYGEPVGLLRTDETPPHVSVRRGGESVDEMACAGSRAEPCTPKPAIMKGILSLYASSVKIGIATRIEDDLVLPKHVYDLADQLAGPAKSVTDIHSHKWKVRSAGPSSDMLFVAVPKDVWSTIGGGKLEAGICNFKAPVTVITVDKGQAYQSHGGLKGRSFDEKHTFGVLHASYTLPGWSGSPVFQGGRVVGMHVAADPLRGCNVFLSLLPNKALAYPAAGWLTRSEGYDTGSYSSDIEPDYQARGWTGRTRQDVLADEILAGNARYIVTRDGHFSRLTAEDIQEMEAQLADPNAWANMGEDEHGPIGQPLVKGEADQTDAAALSAGAVETAAEAPSVTPVLVSLPAPASAGEGGADFRKAPAKTRRVAVSEQPSPSLPTQTFTKEALLLMLKAFESSDESTLSRGLTGSNNDDDSQTGYISLSRSSSTTTGPTTPTSSGASTTKPVVEPSLPPRANAAKRRKRKPKSHPGAPVQGSGKATAPALRASSENSLSESDLLAIQEQVSRSILATIEKSLPTLVRNSLKPQ